MSPAERYFRTGYDNLPITHLLLQYNNNNNNNNNNNKNKAIQQNNLTKLALQNFLAANVKREQLFVKLSRHNQLVI